MIALPSEFILPNYRDGSIANVPPTIANLLGVPFEGLPPLAEKHWQGLGGDVQRVVLLLVDALGWNLVEKERAVMAPLLDQATAVSMLTSVFPSTTVAALSSLWTGAAPAQHGLLGFRLFLRELGVIAQFLSFSPDFATSANLLLQGGLDPRTFLQWPGFAEQLATGGVHTHALRGMDIVDTPLGQMHGRGITAEHGVISFADMMQQVRGLLEQKVDERLYISAYWPEIDTLSHMAGWTSSAVADALGRIVGELQRDLLQPLSPAARAGTVLLIMADHGQVNAPREQQHFIEDYPELADLLLMRPAGEPRLAYLYARQGAQADLLAGLNEQLGGALLALPAQEALEAGLFGPLPHAADAAARLGDVVAILHGGHTLFETRQRDGHNAEVLYGRHGGMTAAEMMVPLIAMRLG